jgi:uncharacterized membrane protein
VIIDSLTNVLRDLHPLIVHFPIAMWTLLFATVVLQRWWPSAQAVGWVAQWVGVGASIIAVITGLRDHEAYEGTSAAASIQVHEFLALGTAALFAILTIWRFIGRRRGTDPFSRWYFVVPVTIGFLLLVLVGATGGQLVFGLGVHVAPVTILPTP